MKYAEKYLQISKTTMSNSLVYLWNFLSKNLFFVLITFIYYMLWKNIYSQKGNVIGGLTFRQMVWYLIMTELVVISKTDLHFQINDDVKSGNISYQLNRPYNYVLYCFSYFAGEIGFKIIVNGILGIIIGFVLVGGLDSFQGIYVPFIVLSLIVGSCINFFIYISLAFTSFWFEENTAFFWIYSKLIFTLGGMLIPLELFPVWLKSLSQYLPFAYVTYVPARLAVSFSMNMFYKQFLIQILYLAVFFIIAMGIYRKGVKNINVNGG